MKPIFKLFTFLVISTAFGQTQTDTIPAYHYFIKADSLLTQRKLDSAVVYFKKALPIYEKAEAWERVARCYNKISEGQIMNEEYIKSLKSAKIALKVFEQHIKNKKNLEQEFLHDIGMIYHWMGDFNNALSNYYKAIGINNEVNKKNNSLVSSINSNIGAVFYNLGKYEEALEYNQKALDLAINYYGKENTKSIYYFNLGRIHIQMQNFDQAMLYHKLTLSIALNNNNYRQIAQSYYGIGLIYEKKGKHDEALKYFEKHLEHLANVCEENNNNLLNALNSIGVIYRQKGQYKKALEYYQKALKIRTNDPNNKNFGFGNVFNNIGVIYKYIGQYDKAIFYLKKALKINNQFAGDGTPHIARNYNNIANVYRLKGEYDESLKYYINALKLRKDIFNENHSELADSYNDIGNLFLVKKEYEKALIYLKKALKIRESIFGQFHPDVADSYEGLGEVYLNKNDFTLSFQNYQKSWDVRLKVFGEHHPEVSLSYNNLAELYREQSNFEKALINYQKAIDANTILNKKNQYFDYNILLTTLQGQAKTYQAIYKQNKGISDLNSVIYTYQKADAIINQLRQSFTNYQDKVRFSKTAKEIYQGAIATQLLRYDIEKNPKSLVQAFYYAERSKANTLKELLNDANAKNFTGLPNKVVELEKELRIDQAFYQSQITKELSSKKTDSVRVTNYESRLFDTSRRQDSLTEVLENNYPKYYQLKHENKLITLAGIQKQLPKNKTLVEFFTSDSITYAFTISKNTLSVEELAIPKLEKQVEKFRKAVLSKDIKNYKTVGYDLYTQLIAPIKDQLVGRELIIIPDGPLWHLNFELLITHDDNSNNPKELSYLLKEYAISYGNSANLLFNTSNNNQKTQKREECLAFSFSDSTNVIDSDSMSLTTLRDAGDDLPGTRKEIKAISEIIDGQYYYGSEAIEANFKKNAGRFNILHLALHGEVDNERPENSKLYFTKSKDTIEDNLLYGHELFALDIPAELTVLSACNTGSGKIAKGEGIMSLGSAFQYAGTKSLLLSSWEVSDQTTPELMRYFYSNLKKGMNKSKALQQAKLQYLQTANINRTHPFYWGGFYLVGDSASIEFSDNVIPFWVLGIMLFLSLIGGLFWYRKKRR